MEKAADILRDFSVRFEMKIVSAHRTPHFMVEYASAAADRGLQVIIAGAGGAAHLPGMVASCTVLPVVGVPIQVGKMNGLDALLSIAQMPRGVPVATMAVDNATNAALMAVRILARQSKTLEKMMLKFQQAQVAKVRAANRKLKKR